MIARNHHHQHHQQQQRQHKDTTQHSTAHCLQALMCRSCTAPVLSSTDSLPYHACQCQRVVRKTHPAQPHLTTIPPPVLGCEGIPSQPDTAITHLLGPRTGCPMLPAAPLPTAATAGPHHTHTSPKGRQSAAHSHRQSLRVVGQQQGKTWQPGLVHTPTLAIGEVCAAQQLSVQSSAHPADIIPGSCDSSTAR